MMIEWIEAEIHVGSREEAIALDEALQEAGANSKVGWKHGKWKVFASFEQSDAAYVGRALLNHEYQSGETD